MAKSRYETIVSIILFLVGYKSCPMYRILENEISGHHMIQNSSKQLVSHTSDGSVHLQDSGSLTNQSAMSFTAQHVIY